MKTYIKFHSSIFTERDDAKVTSFQWIITWERDRWILSDDTIKLRKMVSGGMQFISPAHSMPHVAKCCWMNLNTELSNSVQCALNVPEDEICCSLLVFHCNEIPLQISKSIHVQMWQNLSLQTTFRICCEASLLSFKFVILLHCNFIRVSDIPSEWHIHRRNSFERTIETNETSKFSVSFRNVRRFWSRKMQPQVRTY